MIRHFIIIGTRVTRYVLVSFVIEPHSTTWQYRNSYALIIIIAAPYKLAMLFSSCGSAEFNIENESHDNALITRLPRWTLLHRYDTRTNNMILFSISDFDVQN